MNDYPACIVVGVGWGDTVPIVVRVCQDDQPVTSPILVEAQLGLSWSDARREPAWLELIRRADVALAEHGYTRLADWSHHIHPQPLARARVSRST